MSELLTRNPDVVFQELDGEVLVLRPGGADVLHLNSTASQVWGLLSEPTSREELVQALAEGYRTEPAVVAADVGPLLEVLLEHDVVRAA